jgi:hypothetical protein
MSDAESNGGRAFVYRRYSAITHTAPAALTTELKNASETRR